MGSLGVLRPYYYGDRKWDDYLLDIQEAVDSSITLQTEEFRRIQNTLQSGFEDMRAEFQWGFSLVLDRLDRQIQLVARIAAKLDEIHKTLQSPLMTQARELFQVGQQRLIKGLLDKALEAFLQSEQKNEVDFLLQLQIGKLLLYGRDDDDNVVNVSEAERHLLLAGRYADAEKTTLTDWKEYSGQAYFHAGVATYLLGEEELTGGRVESMRSCLERALRHLEKAVRLWPEFIETRYVLAKCHALLGHPEDVRRQLEVLADHDRRYFAKACADSDFVPLRSHVEDVFLKATVSPGPFARAVEARLDGTREALEWFKRSRPDGRDPKLIAKANAELNRAVESLRGVDVDLVKLHATFGEMAGALITETERSYREILSALKAELNSGERRKTSAGAKIKNLLAEKQTVTGSCWGAGCVGVIAFFLMGLALELLFPPLFGINLDKDQSATDKAMSSAAVLAVIVAVVAYLASREDRMKPLDEQMKAAANEIQQFDEELPPIRERMAELQDQFDRFSAWRASRKTALP